MARAAGKKMGTDVVGFASEADMHNKMLKENAYVVALMMTTCFVVSLSRSRCRCVHYGEALPGA